MPRAVFITAVAAAFLVAAPLHAQASSPASRQAADTVIQAGTYDLAITFNGGLLEATLDLTFLRDSTGVVLKLGDHQSPVKAGARKGNKLALDPSTPGMDVHYDLEFSGTNVKGTFTFQGQQGTLTGKRRTGK